MCRPTNLTAAIVVAITLASLSSLHGEDTDVAAAEPLPLTGKVVLVHLSSKPVYYLLENARIIELGGKTMLAGRFVPVTDTTAQTWTTGLPIGISMDVVETVMVFDTVADYRKRTKVTVQSLYEPARRDDQLERADSAPQIDENELQPSKTPINTPTPRSSNP